MRGNSPTLYGKTWFRDLDSNQDTQLQRLMSYRLDDPGMGRRNCSRGMQACTGAALGQGSGEGEGDRASRGSRRQAACARVDRFWQILKPDHGGDGFERFKAASGLVPRY